jgi:hypothetical protein
VRERRADDSLSAIAWRLNDDQVPTAQGGSWRANTVRSVLIRDGVIKNWERR